MLSRPFRPALAYAVAALLGCLGLQGARGEEKTTDGANSSTAVRYKFKDAQREIYALLLETGDDSDRRVREGNVIYQFNAPSAIGFSLELVLQGSSTQVLGGYQIGARQIIGNPRVKSGPIKYSNLGVASEASDANRTRPIPGDVQGILIIPLPEKGERRWTRENALNLTYTTRGGQSRTSEAVESETFVLQKVVDKSIAIERTLTVKTKEVLGGKPMWELSMKGTIVLSADGGLPLEGEWAGNITQRDDRAEIRTPFRESFRRLSEEAKKAIEAEAAKKKEQSDKFRADMARLEELEKVPVSLRKPLSKTAMDKVLADLKSKDEKVLESAVEALFKAKPDPARRTEVLAALNFVKRSDSSFVTFGAMRLEKDWENAVASGPPTGTKGGKDKGDNRGGNGNLSKEQESEMLGLIKELSSESPRQRSNAATALANYPDERAAKALSAALLDAFVRREATAALKALGPMAADAVVQHVSSGDVFLARSAIEVIKVQGTKKHIEPLQKQLVTERNGIIQRDLREAIAAIQGRD